MRRRALTAVGGGLLLAALVVNCGARTGLRGAQPCPTEGATLACSGECGAGVTTCEAGYWSACRTEVRVEVCENRCGLGTRTCAEEEWTECQVERLERTCENNCGAGVEICEDDAWSGCLVERVERPCSGKCGTGVEICEDDTWARCNAPPPLPPVLTAIIRDFRDTHPDFENGRSGVDLGIVRDELGSDGKPVYAHGPEGTLTTNGPIYFDQWYRDVPGTNATTTIELPLTPSRSDPRLFVFERYDFFPIDDQLFGNQGRPHNFHFTLEAQGTFVYQGGEIFRFTGDDDVFVFINGLLVIDLGGLHESLSAEVSLDEAAPRIGLVRGAEYPLHLFFAERKTVESNFVIETSIAELGDCP